MEPRQDGPHAEADPSPETAYIIRGKSYSLDFVVLALVIVFVLALGLNVLCGAAAAVALLAIVLRFIVKPWFPGWFEQLTCSNCAEPTVATALRCSSCGQKFAFAPDVAPYGAVVEEDVECLECGAVVPAGMTTCPECGWSYEAEVASPPTPDNETEEEEQCEE